MRNHNNLISSSFFLLFFFSLSAAASPDLYLWPLPQILNFTSTSPPLLLSPNFRFERTQTTPLLERAYQRYHQLIFGRDESVPGSSRVVVNEDRFSHGNKFRHHVDVDDVEASALSSLVVKVATLNETLQQGTDESYSISITSTPTATATLTATTPYGVLRGLETFSQLVQFNASSAMYYLEATPLYVKDFPRFGYRGLLIDTSRHFLPLRTIKGVLDSMVYSKFNVLHWHIVDAQSFPVQIFSFPKLWDGSYSRQERYTQRDVYEVVMYAKDRGIRVMLEFDSPGHAYSWGVGYPSALPEGYKTAPNCESVCPPIAGNPCDVPLDPSSAISYQLLDGIVKEMSQIAFENFFHFGGDEVEQGCWSQSPQIKKWMAANNFTSYDDCYGYFVQQAHKTAKTYGKTPVNWEEVFNHFTTSLDKEVIILIWLSQQTLAKVVSAGYQGILSDGNWYLDQLGKNWTQLYLNEPSDGIPDSQMHLVLGGQACMWGETVDTSDIFNTIWPKAAAAGERLWSSKEVNDIQKAAPRLKNFRCLLNQRGVPAAPVDVSSRQAPLQPGSCYGQ